MRIGLLLDPQDICYGTLNFFLFCIERALHKFAVHTERITEINDDMAARRYDAFIGFNRSEPAVLAEDGSYFMDSRFGCPYFNILVDAPYCHHVSLHSHMKNLHVIVMDEGHVEYCGKYYPHCQSVEMGYVLGYVGEPVPYEERKMDLLFTGTYRSSEDIKRQTLSSQGTAEDKEAFLYMIQDGIAHPQKTVEQLLKDYDGIYDISRSPSEFARTMTFAGVMADIYLRSYFREKVVRTLAQAGLNLTLAGSCWEECFSEKYENITMLGAMDMRTVGELTADARILLNVMPWFKDGLHDRIPTAMHNGAICVTDSSSYIDTHFQDGENIVLYRLEELEALPDKCRYLLKHPEKAKAIAEAGRQKAQLEYTWEKFVLDKILKWLY